MAREWIAGTIAAAVVAALTLGGCAERMSGGAMGGADMKRDAGMMKDDKGAMTGDKGMMKDDKGAMPGGQGMMDKR